MPIEYEYENWEEPTNAKRVWRLILGTIAIIAFWLTVIGLVIVGVGMVYAAIHLQSEERGLMILLSAVLLGMLALSIPLIFQIHMALALWRRCQMVVMVIEDDANEGLVEFLRP